MAKKEEKDRVKQDHERLQKAVEDLRAQRQFILDCIKDSRFAKILNRYEQEVEADKEALVKCEKKEIDGLQARVLARRTLICTLKGSYEYDRRSPASRVRDEQSAFLGWARQGGRVRTKGRGWSIGNEGGWSGRIRSRKAGSTPAAAL